MIRVIRLPADLYRMRPKYRDDIADVGQPDEKINYEVLEELYQMWKQAFENEQILSHNGDTPVTVLTFQKIRREGWENAIMIYAGWDGLELHEYLIDRREAEKEDGG